MPILDGAEGFSRDMEVRASELKVGMARLPGKSHGQKNLVGCSTWGHKRVGHELATNTFTFNTFPDGSGYRICLPMQEMRFDP